MKALLERYALKLWYGNQSPAWPWQGLAALHRRLKQGQWARPAAAPPVPVIVVGNLTVGGNGKTPMVLALSRHLVSHSLKVGILCRGVGGRCHARPHRVSASDSITEVGDEALLLARQSGVPVWVGRSRGESLSAAIAAGAEIVISDDGLQHQALPRSFEICMVDGERGFGNGQLLPAGPLRQPVDRLATVDLVVTLGGQAPLVEGVHWPVTISALRRLHDGERQALDALRGQTVTAVCAIGNPQRFAHDLEAQGLIVNLRAFPDHHGFVRDDIERLPGPVLITEKDAVKLEPLTGRQDVWVAEQGLDLPSEVAERVQAHLASFDRLL